MNNTDITAMHTYTMVTTLVVIKVVSEFHSSDASPNILVLCYEVMHYNE